MKEGLDGDAKAAFESLPASLRPPISIIKLLCGGMHTVALSSNGVPYSWGCNDDKALGRDGPEEKVLPVPLKILVDGIAVGDSHSIFYSTIDSVAFMCGLYRVS
jgi:regulator of chromosome condensation